MSPPVTAIMTTLPGREGMARRAVECFRDQRYDGRRKLLVYAGDSRHADLVQASFPPGDDVDVYASDIPAAATLARGVENARRRGGLLALWDDDNQYHPLRLARQADAARPGLPNFLGAAVWHFFDSAELFVVDREVRHRELSTRIVPCTMVAHVEDVPVPVAKWRWRGSPTTVLGQAVQAAHNSDRCGGEWWWVVIGVRGDNANGYEWHRGHAAGERSMPSAWLRERRVLVGRWLDDYRWDGPGGLDVCGRDGVVFEYTPRRGWPPDFPPVGGPEGIEVVTERIEETHAQGET